MPKQNELCTVIANGQNYSNWTSVEVSRNFSDGVIDHAMLIVAELSGKGGTIAGLKLKPNDQVTVMLGSVVAIQGFVYLRQGSIDANMHAVQIGICSNSQPITVSTVDCKPGQYVKQNLQQIASAVFGKVGVNFQIKGAPSGADAIFDRVSEAMGERRFDFIARLANMRNLHMVDSKDGIVAFRGAKSLAEAGGGNAGSLEEGKNILRGRILLQSWDQPDKITVNGQDHNNDSADANRQSTGEAEMQSPKPKPVKIAAEETGPDQHMQMRANQELDLLALKMVDGDITVQGWFNNGGDLWMEHVSDNVTVKSPSILPVDSLDFTIKGVVHRQSTEGGTTTDILLGQLGSDPLKKTEDGNSNNVAAKNGTDE